MKRTHWITAALALAVLIAVAFVVADQIERREDRREEEREAARGPDIAQELRDGTLVPFAKILELVQQHVPGEVLTVDIEDDDGRRIYEIKVLAENGRVRELKLDAHDGQLIEIEDD